MRRLVRKAKPVKKVVTVKSNPARPKIVRQLSFKNLQHFREGSKNFFNFFYKLSDYRKNGVFARFKKKFPDLEKELTSRVTAARMTYSHDVAATYNPEVMRRAWEEFKNRLPWDKLFVAYNEMRNLVYVTDKDLKTAAVIAELRKIDANFLIR